MDSTPLRPFDEMPTISLPNDFVKRLPSYLAMEAARLGPVFRRAVDPKAHPVFGRWMVYMVGPEANKFVLSSSAGAFSNDLGWTPQLGAAFGKSLLNSDGALHTSHRAIMSRAFTPLYLDRYFLRTRDIVLARLSHWSSFTKVDTFEECRSITSDVAAQAVLQIGDNEAAGRLLELFNKLSSVKDLNVRDEEDFYFNTDPISEQETLRTRQAIDDIFQRLMFYRRGSTTDDLLSLLVGAQDQEHNPVSDELILGHLGIIMVTAQETAMMVSWLLSTLAQNVDLQESIRREVTAWATVARTHSWLTSLKALPTLNQALNECLRLYMPFGTVPRGVIQEIQFGGYHVPPGTQVRLALAATHRLSEQFHHPHTYHPERFVYATRAESRMPYAFLPFGAGPHTCLGANLAQLEILTITAEVLQQFKIFPDDSAPPLYGYLGMVASMPRGPSVKVSRLR